MNRIFVNNKITKAQLRKVICLFARQQGVNKVIFNDKGTRVKGTYNPFTKNLYIDTKQTKKELLHTLFHELGHHTAVQKNKWKNYHHCLVECMSVEKIFQIENSVDRIGQKLWNKYVDVKFWGKYKYSYPKKQKNNIIKNFISK